LEHDELRFLRCALRDGEERAHAQLLHLLPAEYRQLQLVALGDVPRGVGDETRCAEISGHHREGARDPLSLGDGDAVRESRLRPALRRVDAHDRRDQRLRPLTRGRLGAQFGVLPPAERKSYRGVLDGGAFESLRPESHPLDSHRVALAPRERRGAHDGTRLGRGPESDEQHALRTLAVCEQQQRLVAVPLEVLLLHRARERAAKCLVERRERTRHCLVGRKRDGEEGRREARGIAAVKRKGEGHDQLRIPAITASPKPVVETSVDPGICRARSYVTVPAAMAFSTPFTMSVAASFQPMCWNIMTPERITLPGLILSSPACFGAVPCVASNTAASSPTLPPGAMPSPPTCAAAASDT